MKTNAAQLRNLSRYGVHRRRKQKPSKLFSVNPKAAYADYLKSAHWKRIKKRKLEQANRRCEFCGSEWSLEVHHHTYTRRGKERLSDLFVLCATCHEAVHDYHARRPTLTLTVATLAVRASMQRELL